MKRFPFHRIVEYNEKLDFKNRGNANICQIRGNSGKIKQGFWLYLKI